MSNVLIDDSTMYDIGDAIRDKLGVATTYYPSEMASAIEGIHDTLGTKTITENGTYDPSDDSLDGYSEVTVSVSSAPSASRVGIIEPFVDVTKLGNAGKYYVNSSSTVNVYSSGLLGGGSVGHTVIVFLATSASSLDSSTRPSVTDFSELVEVGGLRVMSGTLSQSTEIVTGSTGAYVALVEISDGYTPSAYSPICVFKAAESSVETQYIVHSKNGFKFGILPPTGYGILFYSTTFDYNDSSYYPLTWEPLRQRSMKNEVLFINDDSDHAGTGVFFSLITSPSSGPLYYARFSKKGLSESSFVGNSLASYANINGTGTNSLIKLISPSDIPSWTNVFSSIAYISITQNS